MSTSGTVGTPDQSANGINNSIAVKVVDTSEISIISTTSGTAVTVAGSTTITPASMTGISVGTPLTVDTIASGVQETIVVASVTGTTFTAKFRYTHSSGFIIVLNVERQNLVISDPTTYGMLASVATGPAGQTETGLTTRNIQAPLVAGTASIGTVGLNAGTNLVGKVGIDQTTPGTTNGVQVNAALPAGSNTIGAVNINGTVPISGSVSITGALPSGTNSLGTIGLNAGTNIVGKFGIDQTSPGTTNGVQITGPGTLSTNTLYSQILGVYNSTPPTLTTGSSSLVQLDVNGNQKVNLATALPSGSNVIGNVGQNGTWNVGLSAGTNNIGGVTLIDSAGTNKASISSVGAIKVLIDSSTTSSVSLTGANFDGSGNLDVNLKTSIPAGTNSIGTVGLNAGTNIIGKTGIDQTTPGTTNGVQITGPGTVATNPFYAQSGGVYNTTAPSLSNGNLSSFQVDVNGNQKVNLITALPSGANSIGNVGLNAGTNSLGTVGLNAGSNLVGKVGIDQTTPGTTNGVQINAPLPVGTNSIGLVGLNAGTNSIGTVGINAGTNVIGGVNISQTTPGTSNGVQITGPGTLTSNTLYSANVGTYNTTSPTLTNGQVAVTQLDASGNTKVNLATAIPSGSNVIGAVTQSGTWNVGLSAGSNTIGNVGINAGTNSIGTIGLNAGTNIVGKIGIDQTTPGTTNGVQVNAALPTGANTIGAVNLNAGTNSLGTVGLNAGTNVVGGVNINQTTPGTTNGVQITGPGTTISNPIYANLTGIYTTTAPTLTNGQIATNQLDVNGNQKVNVATALPTGTNSIGTVNIGYQPDIVTTGTITVTDSAVAAPANNGVLVSGTSTAGSYVVATVTGGQSAWDVQITGLTSGNLYFEGSFDNSNWIAINGRQTGILNTNLNYYLTTNGVYRGNVAGFAYFRVRAVGTLSGTPAVVIRLSSGQGATFLNASIPPGTDTIGAIRLSDSSTTNQATISSAGALSTLSYNDSTATAVIAAGTSSNTVIKASAGRLVSLLITSQGTSNTLIYDSSSSASGTVIGVAVAYSPIGFVQFFAMPASNGIVVAGNSTGPGFTLSYR